MTKGFCNDETKPLGPDQLKFAPKVFELPARAIGVLLHVSIPPTVAKAIGAVKFCGTLVVAEEVHPFARLETVKV
jgi:hypothetical protein